MTRNRAETAARIRQLLETEGAAVKSNTQVYNERRYDSIHRFDDYEHSKTRAREIKADAIDRLPSLIDELRSSVEENGGHVYVADDEQAANRYISSVVEDVDAESVVKSKSMTSEEIDVNESLETAGVDVVETDLGEFVLQVADEAPSHIVVPALHKSREEIATLFNEVFEPTDSLVTPEELTEFAREYLLERIIDADVGLTGANFLVAESGTMVLVTSEGNARKCAVTPNVHVAIAGVEKIVPTIRDLEPFVELIGRSATGQDLTSYVSFLTPPVNTPPIDFEIADESIVDASAEDREFHLVLLDNGRLAMRDDPDLRETLYCIRCAACSNVCANFQHVGGHAFGGETYSGGIATGWEAGVHDLDSADSFNDLCTGVKRCVPACPVKIDIPWINAVVQDRINHDHDPNAFDYLVDGLTPDTEPAGMERQRQFFAHIDLLARAASRTAPVSNRLASSVPMSLLFERVFGVDRRRSLPAFNRRTLRNWFVDRGGAAVDPSNATRKAVIYPDLYTNYVTVERGIATVRTLEAFDVAVQIPAVGESGRAPYSQGMISTASGRANAVADVLVEHIDAGWDVVVIEPSDHAMFHDEYERFLPSNAFDRLTENSYEVMEYVYGLLDNDPDGNRRLSSGPGDVAYHGHCQQRTLGVDVYTTAVLEALGYNVQQSSVECCGMAGSFGYKRQYYDLSIDVGEELADQFSTSDMRDRIVLTSGTSCTDQLDELLARDPIHPIELIAPP